MCISVLPLPVPLLILLSLFTATDATCQAMASITRTLNGPSNETEICTLSSDCLEITCRVDGDVNSDLSLQLILLPCFSPPAVRIVFSGVINFDSIFRQTESDDVEGTTSRITVTLDRLSSDSIGFQAGFAAGP